MKFFSPPPKPATEAARLQCLVDLEILDTPPDPRLDAIAREAAAVYDAPIGLVSLIDARRQWFKAKVGLDAAETPRSVSFCGHAILEPQAPFVVLDSRTDERFSGNPLVLSAPNVIFYVGIPLVTSTGHAIGTLCVLDEKPRADVSREQLDAHTRLAADVVQLIESSARRSAS